MGTGTTVHAQVVPVPSRMSFTDVATYAGICAHPGQIQDRIKIGIKTLSIHNTDENTVHMDG
jgi:hypothetical protein